MKLIDKTAEVKAALKEQIASGINEAAQWWTDEAQENSNVLTGFMQSHIGVTEAASPERLSATVRSLAPYSGPQDTGRRGNLFWTRAFLSTRQMFKQFLYGKAGSAGGGVIRSALSNFKHEVTDQGLRVTKVRAFGGGFMTRGAGGRFAGRYGGRR